MIRQNPVLLLVDDDPLVRQIFSLIRRLAPHARYVLICGETGTGKELAERACILAEGDLITERELVSVATAPGRAAVSVPVAASQPQAPAPPEQDQDELGLKTVERDHIVRVLERSRGNKRAAAELLGISRRKLYRYLEKYHLHIPQKALEVGDTTPLENTTRH